MAKPLIGLDIGSSSIKVVQLRNASPKGGVVTAFGLEPIPAQTIVDGTIMNQGAVVEAIQSLWKRLKLKPKDVALAIAGHSVIVKKITVPQMSAAELEEQIPWEAENHIPFGKDNVELDYQVVNKKGAGGQMELLLVAAKKEVVHDYAAVAREAGLNPLVVDVAAFTAQNVFEINQDAPAQPGQVVVLINIGASISTINIVSGNASAFTRDVAIGGNAFTDEIQKQLNVSHEEAEAFKVGGVDERGVVPQEVERILQSIAEVVAGEFQRSLNFFLGSSADAQVARVHLSGGSAKVVALQRAIERRARLPVELLDPFKRITIDETKVDPAFVRANAPEAVVGIGLALRSPGDKV